MKSRRRWLVMMAMGLMVLATTGTVETDFWTILSALASLTFLWWVALQFYWRQWALDMTFPGRLIGVRLQGRREAKLGDRTLEVYSGGGMTVALWLRHAIVGIVEPSQLRIQLYERAPFWWFHYRRLNEHHGMQLRLHEYHQDKWSDQLNKREFFRVVPATSNGFRCYIDGDKPQWKPGDLLILFVEFQHRKAWTGIMECWLTSTDKHEMMIRRKVRCLAP